MGCEALSLPTLSCPVLPMTQTAWLWQPHFPCKETESQEGKEILPKVTCRSLGGREKPGPADRHHVPKHSVSSPCATLGGCFLRPIPRKSKWGGLPGEGGDGDIQRWPSGALSRLAAGGRGRLVLIQKLFAMKQRALMPELLSRK